MRAAAHARALIVDTWRIAADFLSRCYFTLRNAGLAQPGGFYGWPYAYIGKHPQPGFANLAPDKVEATITPDLLFQAHSSLLDLVFYEGDQFPAEYKGSLFVALKGPWNRSIPTGYKVVRVPFKDGRKVITRISRPAFGPRAKGAPRSGVVLLHSRSPRTGLCLSPTTPAGRSGGSPTRARPPTRRRRTRDRMRKPRRAGGDQGPRNPARWVAGPSLTEFVHGEYSVKRSCGSSTRRRRNGQSP